MQCQSVKGKIVGTSYRVYSLRIILTCAVVLDEAHKYLINSDTARLTQSISSIIRLQRHLSTRVIIATQVGHHRLIVTRSPCSPHVQEPTVIPSTMLDLASFIICHRFTSPSWCRHLARHVSAGDNAETAQWFQDVMLLATGQCVVFSPSAVVMTNNDSSVKLLGRDFLKLRVRPRLTLDGGTSLLAVQVGRTLPSIAPIADTPAQRELSYTARQAPQPTRSPSISVFRDAANAHAIPSTVPHSEGSGTHSGTSFVSAKKPASTNGPRAVPARLKYLIEMLQNNGGAKTPLNLIYAKSRYFKIDIKEFGTRTQWWKLILEEAEAEGLVELTNSKAKNKELAALGKERTIRLLNSGPFTWV
jgi:hypothetical protein